jgi:hypothetical protein
MNDPQMIQPATDARHIAQQNGVTSSVNIASVIRKPCATGPASTVLV